MMIVIASRRSHITVLFLLLGTILRAQEEKAISQHLGRLRAIFDSAQVFIPKSGYEVSTDSSLITFITQMEVPVNPGQVQEDKLYLAQRELLRRQIGLNYTLDGIQNINPTQQDIEDNILYQRRIQNGVEWNVLKGGYLDSRNEMKALELEQELEQMIASRNPVAGNPGKKSQLTYWFDLEKRKLLIERGKLLDRQYMTVTQLYHKKKISKDVLLALQSRITEVKALEDIYSLYPDYVVPLYDSVAYSWDASLFDLNYETILYSARREKESADTAFSALLSRIEQQNKWFNEIQLKAYVRHSYYDLVTINPGSRAFFSTGVGLSVPLTFTHKEQNAIEREYALLKMGQMDGQLEDRRLVMLSEAYDYRLRLKNYIMLHQRRAMVLEEIRAEREKERLGDPEFNPLRGLELVDELLRIELELMDLKLDLYLRLVKVHELMETYPIQALIVPLQLTDDLYPEEASLPEVLPEEPDAETKIQDPVPVIPADPKPTVPVVEKTDDYEIKLSVPDYVSQRNIYVRSKIFLNYSAEHLAHYVQDNTFTGVQLSVSSRDELLDQKIAFLKTLNDYHIQTDLMYSRGAILDMSASSMHAELLQTISHYPLKYVHGLHLNVEPHTRDDWENNQAFLKDSYRTLVTEARSICDSLGFKLTVDLPLTLDTTYVNEVLSRSDMVRFTCYENTRKNYLVRKLRPYLDHKEKLVIALSTEDFKSREDMEQFAERLKKETGIQAVNFHDLSQLMTLDLRKKSQPEKTAAPEKAPITDEEPEITINKNVYVWSRTFGYYAVRYLAAYIDTNQFKEVQLAIVRGDVYLGDKRAFMIAMNQLGVKIDLMFAQKQILNVGSVKMRMEMSQTLAKYPMKYVQGIHLDIEPHTRRDWRRNPEGLKMAYSMLLEEARFICDSLGLKLSVDIPVSYDAAFINAALRKADVVRLLCYNTSRKNAIIRRLKPYLAQKEKLAIALRTEDFRSTKAMEELAIALAKETGITTINFHDLRNLIELDR